MKTIEQIVIPMKEIEVAYENRSSYRESCFINCYLTNAYNKDIIIPVDESNIDHITIKYIEQKIKEEAEKLKPLILQNDKANGSFPESCSDDDLHVLILNDSFYVNEKEITDWHIFQMIIGNFHAGQMQKKAEREGKLYMTYCIICPVALNSINYYYGEEIITDSFTYNDVIDLSGINGIDESDLFYSAFGVDYEDCAEFLIFSNDPNNSIDFRVLSETVSYLEDNGAVSFDQIENVDIRDVHSMIKNITPLERV